MISQARLGLPGDIMHGHNPLLNDERYLDVRRQTMIRLRRTILWTVLLPLLAFLPLGSGPSSSAATAAAA